MRGKVARELRKLAKFNPNAPREYKTWEVGRQKRILQWDHVNKKINIVTREVTVPIIECVSAERNFYKFFKKQFTRGNVEQRFTELPSEKELRILQDKLLDTHQKEADDE